MENVVSIMGQSGEKYLEKYFDEFLSEFYGDKPNRLRLAPYRETIRYSTVSLIKILAEDTANNILIINSYRSKNSDKLLFNMLSDKIRIHLEKYRIEHCSKFRIMVSNILGV